MTVALIGYYTITPTHCGTGQAADAVDLPIARECHSGHPIFPATSIKGSIRNNFEKAMGKEAKVLETWFGPRLDPRAAENGDNSLHAGALTFHAGALTFGEGRLLAFPVRSLHIPFCHVTCPLILERLERDVQAYGLGSFWSDAPTSSTDEPPWAAVEAGAMVSPSFSREQPLVLEDLAFDSSSDEVTPSPAVASLAKVLGELLPQNEKPTKKRLASHLVVLRDDYFADLVRRTTPVQARICLNDQKTTSGGGGNLWYEENLPSDTLLASFVGVRSQTRNGASGNGGNGRTAAGNSSSENGTGTTGTAFFERLGELTKRPLQIGGNETVGQGVCLWHVGAKNDG